MNYAEMSIEELVKRADELRNVENPETRSTDELENMANELNAINAELEARKEKAKENAELRNDIANDKDIESRKIVKENKPMTFEELRASKEYSNAYLNLLKTGDDNECRALLSTNGTAGSLTGYVPVPTFLEAEIKTAWESHELLNLVKHSYFKGNVKIAFELSATGAVVHAEGATRPDEEVVTLGTVEIKAETIKKWISVSDEALEGTTVDTMGYLYKEIAHKIVEKAEEILIAKIEAAPTTSTSTAVAVKEMEVTTLAADTIVNAVSMLSGSARNLHIAMNRGTYATLVGVALNANYAIDVFDGLKDRIVYTDKLPAIGDADADDVIMIIGDFGYGMQANFPNGNDLSIKVDNLSLAEYDLVKLIGKQYVGIAVVAENAFVRVVKGSTT